MGLIVMDETRFETTIIFDECKMNRCLYTIEELYLILDEVFANVGMYREGNTFKNGTLALVGGVIVALVKFKWILEVVKEWTLVGKENGVIFYEENILGSQMLRVLYLDKYGL